MEEPQSTTVSDQLKSPVQHILAQNHPGRSPCHPLEGNYVCEVNICSTSRTPMVHHRTPIQNRLTDIFSLLHFLKVRPYDDLQTFQEQILRPWKSKMDEAALKRLQSIMKAIAILAQGLSLLFQIE